MLRRAWQLLMPQEAERDPGFAQEILSLSHLGLRITAWAQIAVPLLMLFAQLVVTQNRGAARIYALQSATIIALGMLTLAAARLDRYYEQARAIALCSVFLTGVTLVVAGLLVVLQVPGVGHYIPGRITGLMMLAMAVIPLLPWQTFALGSSLGVCYLASERVFREVYGMAPEELTLHDNAFMGVMTVISTGLTAVVYQQRAARYGSYIMALRASMDLRRAQSQMLLTESAASLGRLAAALSHELNTPLGVLRSAVETLAGLAPRVSKAPLANQERLLELQQDLYQSMLRSVDRLREIIGRMQRYTNLDRAEVQVVELDGLIRDVVALHGPMFAGRAEVELALTPLPPVLCRPQLLSAVFSNLITNAVEACDGGGRVVVTARQREGEAQIVIRDNGRGLSAREVSAIFDPGFRVEQGKVATGNWSLFGARQIVHDHGGEIRIESREGEGTQVSVTLPLPAPAGAGAIMT